MQRTKIEWIINPDGSRGYVCNPIKGKCPQGCYYCYAEVMRKRFKKPREMTWRSEELQACRKLKKPSTIFIGSVFEIFGEWVPSEYLNLIYQVIDDLPQHTFILLTKNPSREWWLFSMPANLWFGASVTSSKDKENGYNVGGNVVGSRNAFISFEPVLDDIVNGDNKLYADGVLPLHKNIKWIILGSLNKNGRPVKPEKGGTKKEWVYPILDQANKYNIPVFIKEELNRLFPDLPIRKEVPYLK